MALDTAIGTKCVSGLCNSPINGFFIAEETLKNLNIMLFIFLLFKKYF